MTCQAKCPTAKGSDRQVACAKGHRRHTCLSPFGGLWGQRWEAQDASTNRYERLLHWVSEADWRVPRESGGVHAFQGQKPLHAKTQTQAQAQQGPKQADKPFGALQLQTRDCPGEHGASKADKC